MDSPLRRHLTWEVGAESDPLLRVFSMIVRCYGVSCRLDCYTTPSLLKPPRIPSVARESMPIAVQPLIPFTNFRVLFSSISSNLKQYLAYLLNFAIYWATVRLPCLNC
ncbi:hypothetical protein M9H77_13399 [Catharanthus roseus]|uniref:Uncharacterized protein n=1 Tax=Catharanthus roseus TaxID=4058 RepID=A0ACC0BK88_CATRO|nr:hypothetical protein M9H77_13399 [Catharanthus roseus]